MKTSIYTLILEFLKKILITSFVFLLVLQETKSKNIESKTIFELQNVLKEISQKNNTIFFEKTLKAVKNSYDAEKMIKMIVAGRWSKISDDKKKVSSSFLSKIHNNELFENVSKNCESII